MMSALRYAGIIAAALVVIAVTVCFIVGSWSDIDARGKHDQYSGPDRRRPKTGDRP